MRCTLLKRQSMVLAIDIRNACMGVAPVTKIYPVTVKEDQGKAVLGHYMHCTYITCKTEHVCFKSGCVVRVAKHSKEDWFKVLR